jgi:hypothetical protein
MFAVEEAEPWARRPGRWVVDHERGMYLQRVAGIGRQAGGVFVLAQGDIEIPFEMVRGSAYEPDGSGTRTTMSLRFFGGSRRAADVGIASYEFADDAEKDHWMRIAAEALLVYGVGYAGLSIKDGILRVDLNGQLVTLSTFGYTTQDNA